MTRLIAFSLFVTLLCSTAGAATSVPPQRSELQRRGGLRERYTAFVARFGVKRSYGYEAQTILLTNVRDAQGTLVTDHLWFARGKWAEKLAIGDGITFEARVTAYENGYVGERLDVIGERGYGQNALPPP